MAPDTEPFRLERDGASLSGEVTGEGPPVVMLHGLTATRRYVLHGSKALARRGFSQVSFDARAHGESSGAADGRGYGYPAMASDVAAVISARAGGPPVLCGDSMGSHTAAAYALENARDLAGIVLVRPVSLGLPAPAETLGYWDRLADGLEGTGVDGFMAAYEDSLEAAPEFRDTILRFTRERMTLHRHPAALADAIREVARSLPFGGIGELETLDVPALVVGSRDEADPGHPLAVAEAWSEALPRAELISEGEGESPLAWQGGRLARAVADFCERPEVSERR